jgi:DNA-binding transcriptional LysR family regulator
MLHAQLNLNSTQTMAMPDATSGGPTLRQLELLLTLASSDGIASAGARLGMTPSATSHSLRALEKSLGIALIDRNAPGVKLTHAGEAILPHVRDVFASLQIVRATANAGAKLDTGLLTIGSHGASSSLNVLPPILEAFKKRYPGVDVFVTEKPDVEIARDIIERRIEIGVVALPKDELDTQILAVDELLVVLPPDHPLAALDTVPVKALADYPIVMTHAGSQPVIARMFAKAKVKPRIVHDLTQILSILEFVRRGHFGAGLARAAAGLPGPGVPAHPAHVHAPRGPGLPEREAPVARGARPVDAGARRQGPRPRLRAHGPRAGPHLPALSASAALFLRHGWSEPRPAPARSGFTHISLFSTIFFLFYFF